MQGGELEIFHLDLKLNRRSDNLKSCAIEFNAIDLTGEDIRI
jgi:hypothetical protein